MKIIIRLFLVQLFAARLLAGENPVIIGETTFVIPTPPGFVPVTQDMTSLAQMLEMVVPPQNARFASYFPDDLLPAVRRGEIPQMPRALSLQTDRGLVSANINRLEFARYKEDRRKENADLVRQAAKQAQSKSPPEKSGSTIMVLPPHEESGRSLAYSTLVTVTAKDADGQPRARKLCVTTTFLHARGKILFLYVNGAEHDLEWTRRVSKDWADKILVANPSEAMTVSKDAPLPKGSNWGTVIYYMLLGAIIGGVIGAAVGFARYLARRKPSV